MFINSNNRFEKLFQLRANSSTNMFWKFDTINGERLRILDSRALQRSSYCSRKTTVSVSSRTQPLSNSVMQWNLSFWSNELIVLSISSSEDRGRRGTSFYDPPSSFHGRWWNSRLNRYFSPSIDDFFFFFQSARGSILMQFSRLIFPSFNLTFSSRPAIQRARTVLWKAWPFRDRKA